MDEIETKFLKSQEPKPLVSFRYIDDDFFIWTYGKEKLEEFLNNFSNYHLNIKFTAFLFWILTFPCQEVFDYIHTTLTLQAGIINCTLHLSI